MMNNDGIVSQSNATDGVNDVNSCDACDNQSAPSNVSLSDENSSEKKRKIRSGKRGKSRLCAVQALYQLLIHINNDTNGLYKAHEKIAQKDPLLIKQMDQLIHQIICGFNGGHTYLSEDEKIENFDKDFFEELFKLAIVHIEEIDKIISKFLSKNWELHRLNIVIANILRCGVVELKFLKIPHQIVMNEYIEITRSFSSEEDCQFVNACLNSINFAVQQDTENDASIEKNIDNNGCVYKNVDVNETKDNVLDINECTDKSIENLNMEKIETGADIDFVSQSIEQSCVVDDNNLSKKH